MNVLNKVTWSAMWKNKTRTVVTIIGIILSAAMFTAVTTLGISGLGYLINVTVAQSGDYFLRFDYSTGAQKALADQSEPVSQMGTLSCLGYATLELNNERGSMSETYVIAAGDDAFFDMIPITLEEGRLPEAGGEIVITRNAYYYLLESGRDCEIGQTVTLDVVPTEAGSGLDLPQEGAPFTKTYTIVGISEYFTRLDDETLDLSHFFTRQEGGEQALWHRLFLKTDPPKAVYGLQNQPLGMTHSINSELLALYGASKYTNYNHFLYTICAILIAIIMAGSISLIYNAFSISVSERTKQFGLLSSVGATKKQLRKSVYFEALALSAISIPFGIFFGYFGIAVTLYLIRDLLDGILYGVSGGEVVFRAIPSPAAFFCAGLVTVLTTLLSALIPARRATRVEPIAAIRQTQDYRIPKRLPGSKGSIFGFPGVMARKYYQVSRSKYRSTVVSLSITMVLFLSATGFSSVLQSTAQEAATANSFDIVCYGLNREQLEEARSLPGVEKSMVQYQKAAMTLLDKALCSEEYLALPSGEDQSPFKFLYFVYLEDVEFEALLRQQGLDPEESLNSPIPPALVSNARFHRFDLAEDGAMTAFLYEAPLLREGVGSLPVYPDGYPQELSRWAQSILGPDVSVEQGCVNGRPVWIFEAYSFDAETGIAGPDGSPALYAAVQKVSDTVFTFHPYDPDTDTLGSETICRAVLDGTVSHRIIGSLSQWPYGTPERISFGQAQLALWLPLSAAGEVAPEQLELVLNTSDHRSVVNFLKAEGIVYTDYREGEIFQRNLVTMVNVFSYGFIVLISLICVCNIFNTVSTNIALRRRDLGMLRSVGMENRMLCRMLELECLRYGLLAALLGLPPGIGADWSIWNLTQSLSTHTYRLPWGPIFAALAAVFSVVFASMAYALSKLRKDDPIEAIRMENL